MRLVPYEDQDDKLVENVYSHVETDDGKPLIEYHECGSHAFYVSPQVIEALKKQEKTLTIIPFDKWLEEKG